METLQQLASMDARELSRLLTSTAQPPLDLEQGEWLAVVQLLTARVTEDCEALSADDWQVASAGVEGVLATAEAVGSIDHNESVIRRLNISAALLQRVSPQDDVPLLSLARMRELFEEAIPITVEEARDLATDWRSREVSVIRQLRLAKNLATPMLLVSTLASDYDILAELSAWRDVLPFLP